MDVLVVGDVNPDIIMRFSGFPERGRQKIAKRVTIKIGGSAANTAVALSKLGLSVRFIGSTGKDFFGSFCLRELEKARVKADIRTSDAHTGFTVAVEDPEERTMFTFKGANEFLDVWDIPPTPWLHLSGYWHLTRLRSRIHEIFRQAKERGAKTSFDFGSWTDDWSEGRYVRRALESGLIDFFFCDEEEIQAFTGMDIEEAIEYVSTYATLGLHMGKKGALIVKGSERHHVPTRPLRILVKTGAGDMWNAGFIWGYLKTGSAKRAGEIGMAIVQHYLETGEVVPIEQ